MFQLRTEDRLRSWREFRSSIGNLSLKDALSKTAEFWANAPFTPYYLDSDTTETWPDPWQLIDENVYCDIAKSLGIIYTMLLTNHKNDLDIELRIYVDTTTGAEYNLAWFNQGKYILNLVDREVVNNEQFDETVFKLKRLYSSLELKLENY
jgi:hypothetical protein